MTYYLHMSGEIHYINDNLTLLELLKHTPTCLHAVIQDYEFHSLEVQFDCVKYKIERNK